MANPPADAAQRRRGRGVPPRRWWPDSSCFQPPAKSTAILDAALLGALALIRKRPPYACALLAQCLGLLDHSGIALPVGLAALALADPLPLAVASRGAWRSL